MEPTVEWITETKKKYPKIAKSTIGGDVFVYRQLSRKEHLDIQKKVYPDGIPTDAANIKPEDNAIIEEGIINLCLLWPEKALISELPAGVVPNLVPAILWFSGFAQPSEPEEL